MKTPALSLILPANNEAMHIAACLEAVLASNSLVNDATVQIVVVPNGCSDDTAVIARSFREKAQLRGWKIDVIELEQGSKLAALNAGDTAANAPVLAYLDADVIVSSSLLKETEAVLSGDAPAYASGQVRLSPAKSWATRAYAKFYLQTPFMKQSAPGCGFFAMNKTGRARWAEWPEIISDDTFARLSFASHERHQVNASYDWPLVEGLANLIKVRRRQNAGVAELEEKFAELTSNDAKIPFAPSAVLKAVLAHPFGTLVYGSVSIYTESSSTRLLTG